MRIEAVLTVSNNPKPYCHPLFFIASTSASKISFNVFSFHKRNTARQVTQSSTIISKHRKDIIHPRNYIWLKHR